MFLAIQKRWDPSLMILLFTSVGLNMITFTWLQKKNHKPLLAEKLEFPNNKTVDFKLVLGAILFGLGWGLAAL